MSMVVEPGVGSSPEASSFEFWRCFIEIKPSLLSAKRLRVSLCSAGEISAMGAPVWSSPPEFLAVDAQFPIQILPVLLPLPAIAYALNFGTVEVSVLPEFVVDFESFDIVVNTLVEQV